MLLNLNFIVMLGFLSISKSKYFNSEDPIYEFPVAI